MVNHLSNQFLMKMWEKDFEVNKENDFEEFKFDWRISDSFYNNKYKLVNVFGESHDKFVEKQQTIVNQYHQRMSDFERKERIRSTTAILKEKESLK